MREFTTAAKAAEVTIDGRSLSSLKFKLDNEEYIIAAPKDTQLAYLITAGASSRDEMDKVAAILDFLEQVLMEPGKARLRKRMLDTKDALGFETIIAIYNWMIEEWGGRPPT